MNQSILAGLPIGLLIITVTYLIARQKKSEWQRSQQAFPALAAELGLEHVARNTPESIGSVTGELEGFTVRIDADETARIAVRFRSAPEVHFRSYAFLKRAPKDFEEVWSGTREFDGWFAERYASAGLAQRISAAPDLGEIAKQLSRSPQPIAALSVTPEGIDCRLKTERVSYISRESVVHLLKTLIRLARIIEPIAPQPERDA